MKTNIPLEKWWEALPHIEKLTSEQLSDKLTSWEQTVQKTVEAGMKSPLVVGERKGEIDLQISSLFLKKTIMDLRCVWLLISQGYTSQAAAIAASLYENALVVICLAGSPERAKELQNTKYGDLPWSVTQLAKMATKKDLKNTSKQDEKAWKLSYHNYKFLCKIKHPTLQQAHTEAKATKVNENKFLVAPLPDMDIEDDGMRDMILIISVSKLLAAAKQFTFSQEIDENHKSFQDFAKSYTEAYTELKHHIELMNCENIPIRDYDFKI